MKNDYARKLQAKKKVEEHAIYMTAVKNTIGFMEDMFTLALHKEGFGKERIERVSGYLNEYVEEYSKLQAEDQDYADAKLQEAIKRIME